eukprot:bmy_22303T0
MFYTLAQFKQYQKSFSISDNSTVISTNNIGKIYDMKQGCHPSSTGLIFLLRTAGALTIGSASDPAFSSQLRCLLKATVIEYFKKESGSGGPLSYSVF